MARKKRRLVAGKQKRSKTASRKGHRRRTKRRARSIGDKVAGAYRTVVDTIRDTGRLRNKIEPSGTSETE